MLASPRCVALQVVVLAGAALGADQPVAFGATPLADVPPEKPFDMDAAVEEAGHWQSDWGTAPPPPPHKCEDWCNPFTCDKGPCAHCPPSMCEEHFGFNPRPPPPPPPPSAPPPYKPIAPRLAGIFLGTTMLVAIGIIGVPMVRGMYQQRQRAGDGIGKPVRIQNVEDEAEIARLAMMESQTLEGAIDPESSEAAAEGSSARLPRGSADSEDGMEEIDLSTSEDLQVDDKRAANSGERDARFADVEDNEDSNTIKPQVARATKPDRMDDDVMFRFKDLA